MSYSKADLFNITFSKLQLGIQVEETDSNEMNEVRVLNQFWDTAFFSTLQDLDLDSTASEIKLELVEEPEEGPWTYAYKYPDDCVLLRRIMSGFQTDNASTHISKVIRMNGNLKCIYTDQPSASAEIISKKVLLGSLNPMAAMAVCTKLALLAAPLLVGKGSKDLYNDLRQEYVIFKTEAQETDRLENMNYEQDSLRSEFVQARLS